MPHHWLPFAVDARKFGTYAGAAAAQPQPYDVGFTGASGADKYPIRDAILETIKTMSVRSYLGTWWQHTLNRADNRSWKSLSHEAYAQTMARSKMWVSTTGPSDLVGTRYYEVLASGTTMLLCNVPPSPSAYDGLFRNGVHVSARPDAPTHAHTAPHNTRDARQKLQRPATRSSWQVVLFDGMDDLRTKITYYAQHDDARRSIVRAARELVLELHTWDARARFISKVAEGVLDGHAPRYTPPPEVSTLEASSRYVGCFDAPTGNQLRAHGLREPAHSRNRRKLWRYTVEDCQSACRGAGFGLSEGGFSTGNAHAQGRCLCAVRRGTVAAPRPPQLRARPEADCATTCTLHDPRPCGGPRAIALFEPQR